MYNLSVIHFLSSCCTVNLQLLLVWDTTSPLWVWVWAQETHCSSISILLFNQVSSAQLFLKIHKWTFNLAEIGSRLCSLCPKTVCLTVLFCQLFYKTAAQDFMRDALKKQQQNQIIYSRSGVCVETNVCPKWNKIYRILYTNAHVSY